MPCHQTNFVGISRIIWKWSRSSSPFTNCTSFPLAEQIYWSFKNWYFIYKSVFMIINSFCWQIGIVNLAEKTNSTNCCEVNSSWQRKIIRGCWPNNNNWFLYTSLKFRIAMQVSMMSKTLLILQGLLEPYPAKNMVSRNSILLEWSIYL